MSVHAPTASGNARTKTSLVGPGIFTRSTRSVAQIALALVLGAFGAACSSASGQAPAIDPGGPGTKNASDKIACNADADCNDGEVCNANLCQMRRCSAQSYASQPPLGRYGYVQLARELVVATSDATVQSVAQQSDGLTLDGDKVSIPGTPLDVAGGNLTGSRPEAIAFVADKSSSVTVLAPDGSSIQLDLGFQGKRVAAGDVDGDGFDEIAVAGAVGEYAVCSAVRRSCDKAQSSRAADDIAVGDVDGDGFAEVLMIGNHTLTIISYATGKPVITSQPVSPALTTLAAGDLDGDKIAEIVGTDAGGSFSSPKMHLFQVGKVDLQERAQIDVSGPGDIVITKLNDKPRIGFLIAANTIIDPGTGYSTDFPASLEVYSYTPGTITKSASLDLTGTNATRLAAADTNGDSPSIHLGGGPYLGAGPVVPIAVVTLPPYSAQHSAGPSSATMGTSQDTSTQTSHGTSNTTSISLTLGGGIGLGTGGALGRGAPNPATGAPTSTGGATPAGLPWSVGVSVNDYVTQTWSNTISRSKSNGTTLSISTSYTMSADPQQDGYNAGGVVLAGGCYHQYDYVVDDPAGVLGMPTNVMSTFVPIGGETTFWSVRRYNALVDALGDPRLPKVSISYKLGDVASYPTSPVTLDGDPIADADNVFPQTPVSRTSDVGTVSFSLTASQNTTNSEASSYNFSKSKSLSVGVNASIGILNANASVQTTHDNSWGLDQSYSITVGQSASFSGQISPVRDDPSTPGNEATIYGYSFQPFVYRHHYTGDAGDGAYYVLTYTAGK